jgi:hypothetical protein
MGNTFNTNEWINPEANLSEIVYKLNLFISWPNFTRNTFPAILGMYFNVRSRYSDSLRAGRSGDRIPVGAKFFAPVQIGPWGPPSLLYNGYRISIPGVKRPGRGVDHPPPSSARVKERVQLNLHSPSWPVLGRNLSSY